MENKETLLENYTKPMSFSADFESYDFLDDVLVADEFDSEEEYDEALVRAKALLDSMCIVSIPDMNELDAILYELAYHRVVIDLPLRDALLDLLESDDDLTTAIEKIRSYNSILQKKHVAWSYHEWAKKAPSVDEDLDEDLGIVNAGDNSRTRSNKYRAAIKELNAQIDALKKLKGIEDDDESYMYVINDENLNVKGMKTAAHNQIEFILGVYRCKDIKNIDQIQFLLWRLARHRLKITPVVYDAIVKRIHADHDTVTQILRLIKKYKFMMQNKQGGLSLNQYYEHLYNRIKNKTEEPSYDELLKETNDLKKKIGKLEKQNDRQANIMSRRSAMKKYVKAYQRSNRVIRSIIYAFIHHYEIYEKFFDFRKQKSIVEFFTCCFAANMEVSLLQIEGVYESYGNEVDVDFVKSQYDSYMKNLTGFREAIKSGELEAEEDDIDEENEG